MKRLLVALIAILLFAVPAWGSLDLVGTMPVAAQDADCDGIPDSDDNTFNEGLCGNGDGGGDDDGDEGVERDPSDRDGDRYPNSQDECPDTPGTAALQGCPRDDRDADDIPNQQDECPDLAGTAENSGCPISTELRIPETPLPEQGPCFAVTGGQYDVFVRIEPSENAEIVDTLEPGEEVSVEERSANGEWYRIPGGWIARRVIETGGSCEDVPPAGNGNEPAVAPDGTPIAATEGNICVLASAPDYTNGSEGELTIRASVAYVDDSDAVVEQVTTWHEGIIAQGNEARLEFFAVIPDQRDQYDLSLQTELVPSANGVTAERSTGVRVLPFKECGPGPGDAGIVPDVPDTVCIEFTGEFRNVSPQFQRAAAVSVGYVGPDAAHFESTEKWLTLNPGESGTLHFFEAIPARNDLSLTWHPIHNPAFVSEVADGVTLNVASDANCEPYVYLGQPEPNAAS